MREHIQRHHPAWYRDLTAKLTQAKAIKKIPPHCKECERFRTRPERIIPALQVRAYPALKALLDAKGPKASNTQDALIAEVAFKSRMSLITADKILKEVAESFGIRVVFFSS
jgi:predicted nucleic acid-binding protein